MGEERRVQGVGGETGGRENTGRPRRRWENSIKMDHRKLGCGSVDWIDMIQDRDRWRAFVNAVVNLRAPYKAGNFLTRLKTG